MSERDGEQPGGGEPGGMRSFTAEEVEAVRREADRRVVTAELRAAAMRAGMVDPDGVRLLDAGAVTLGADGMAVIPDGFFEEARRQRPWLFAPTRTGSTARAPASEPPAARNATEMSFEEWQTARAALLRRG